MLIQEQNKTFSPENPLCLESAIMRLEYLLDNPPKYKTKKWSKNKKTLSVKFCGEIDCVENANIRANFGLPEEAGNHCLVHLKIKHHGSSIETSARVKDSDITGPLRWIDCKRETLNRLINNPPEPLEMAIMNLNRRLGDLRSFLLDYSVDSVSEDGIVTYKAKNNAEHLTGKDISFSIAEITSVPTAKEFIDNKFVYCYDLEIGEIEDTNLGAVTTIRYQHLSENGASNPVPWQITISNYKSIQAQKGRKKSITAELHMFFSDEEYREIFDFVRTEWEKLMLYKMELSQLLRICRGETGTEV